MKYDLRKATGQYLILLTILLCSLLLITCIDNDDSSSKQRNYKEFNRLENQSSQTSGNSSSRVE